MTDETSTVHGLAVRLAVVEHALKWRDTELERQAREYERRLTVLNHAHEKQVEDQARYVSIDSYNGYVANQDEWRDKVDRTLNILEGRSGGVGLARTTIQQNILLVIFFVGMLVSIAVAIWK